MPTTSATDRATAAIEDLVHELKKPQPSTPLLARGSPVNAAFRQLTALFEKDRSTENSSPAEDRSSPTDHAPPRVVDETDQPPRVPKRHESCQYVADETTRPTTRASQPKQDLKA